DLDTVRDALGVAQWNLYGVSYGTRVAQHYLRRFPEHTRSVILDAVVAPQKPIGPEIPVHSQAALDALFERCAGDEGCNDAFPDLPEKTYALFESLKDDTRTVQYENVALGTVDTMQFNDQHLAATVRLLSYSSYGTAILPSMLHDAATNNNLAPFARQSAMQINQVGGALATGMHAAVICTEDAPTLDATADFSALANTYLGGFIVDAMLASCDQWPMGVIDSDFHEPVSSQVPVLALSGAVDPITPPAYADLAIESLTNARHIINPHQGHTQAPLGCMPSVMSQFIDTANPRDLHLECLERLSPPALFVDANGPLP
ncbi:MAG: alpha/beta fold hydrolase, partial [Pseudomonadota bacterium]